MKRPGARAGSKSHSRGNYCFCVGGAGHGDAAVAAGAAAGVAGAAAVVLLVGDAAVVAGFAAGFATLTFFLAGFFGAGLTGGAAVSSATTGLGCRRTAPSTMTDSTCIAAG